MKGSPKSYYARITTLPGKLLLGGGKVARSSRFQKREAADAWGKAMCEQKGAEGYKIVRSNKEPEIP